MVWTTKPTIGTQLDRSNPINNGLIAFWLFNEGSGNIVNDISGNSKIGTIHNSGWILDGRLGVSISFDGIDDYIEADQQLITGYPFSISTWVRASPIGTLDYVIFSLTDKNIEHTQYGIYVGSNEAGRVVIRANNKGVESSSSDSPISTRVDNNNWYHIVAIYESATQRRLYVNNVLILTSTVSITYDTNVNRWSIGRWGDSTPKSYFKGAIDEVRVYNRALTNTEISTLYNNPYSMFLIPTIVVTSPKGGETWIRGNTYTITWTNTYTGGYVKIQTYVDGSLSSTQTSSTPNDGEWVWVTDPKSINIGTKFKIRITNLIDGSYGESANFFTFLPAGSVVPTTGNSLIWFGIGIGIFGLAYGLLKRKNDNPLL